jgi:hypothetical protein
MSYKYRDPTELRARYKALQAALAKWNDTCERMLSGDPLAREQMPGVTKEHAAALQKFSEESQYFVKSGPKM